MTDLTTSDHALGQLVRVSVIAGDRRLDVGAPGSVPVAELVPGLARTLNLLDPATVYGGYRLLRADGARLDSARSLQAQGVSDGDVLTLTAGADDAEHRVYDDIVEAVADVVESDDRPWTPKDAATTAVMAAVALLLTGAVVLFGTGPGSGSGSMLTPIVAGLTAVILAVCSAVVSHLDGPPAAPSALVMMAAVFAALAGLSATGEAPSWGRPTALAGAGALLAGALGLLAMRERREYCLIPAVVGLVFGGVGLAVWLTSAPAGSVLAVATAVAGLAGIGVPWLALASTPLRVVSARDDEEILAEPPEVDRDEVARLYGRGHRLQVALRIGVGMVTILATPAVVGTGLFGTALLVLAYAGMLLSVRETYSRADVLAVMTIAILGVAVTGLSAALLHPAWRTGLTIVIGIVAAAVIGLSLVSPKPRLRLGRLADTAELACLAALLPLAVAAAGWV